MTLMKIDHFEEIHHWHNFLKPMWKMTKELSRRLWFKRFIGHIAQRSTSKKLSAKFGWKKWTQRRECTIIKTKRLARFDGFRHTWCEDIFLAWDGRTASKGDSPSNCWATCKSKERDALKASLPRASPLLKRAPWIWWEPLAGFSPAKSTLISQRTHLHDNCGLFDIGKAPSSRDSCRSFAINWESELWLNQAVHSLFAGYRLGTCQSLSTSAERAVFFAFQWLAKR